tara:strand:+ start:808 stop:957 length:150 start_codon:yes stop_codon:yes gene_type:complete
MKETNDILLALAVSWGFDSFADWFAAHGNDIEFVKTFFHDTIEVVKSEK